MATTDTHFTASGTSPTAPTYLTISDVAERFSVSERTVRNWMTAGLLTGIKIGPRMYRFTEADVEAFLAASA